MKKRKCLLFILFCFCTINSFAKNIIITVDPSKKITDVYRTFFGTNALHSFETDNIRKMGTKLLKDMKCGSLRFPGGEVSDIYLWKNDEVYGTGLRDTVRGKIEKAPSNYTDTDELLAWSKEIGAEPVFVVNMDTFLDQKKSIQEGAAYAAEWVEYCNIKKN